MLVYITQMSRTLLEAAQYLRTAPDGALRSELMDNGRQMQAQIQVALEGHRGDLRSQVPLKQLEEIKMLWENGGELLEERLKQFIQELPNQINYRVRAVFFAELGEKWDAMESVYEYMRDDPRFDPVVVRTPVGRVVERNGKQEQEIIYKDFLTPMGIPSLGYDQYNIEEDCPELAFISQPYESCTVEQFWPENIAKHTRLVYLPYYLPDVVDQDAPMVLAQLPVYRVAWKVVCPTKKQLNFYCHHAANKGSNALLAGLPKLDHLVKLRECGISDWPKGWAPLRDKRVFLWNTWYAYNGSALRNFEFIFGWVQEHKDCALIWRPHPMTNIVTKLYYPERYPVYQECVRQARSMENVVLDTEISYAAAFSVSHAIISDYSSLLPQYLLMNKPALWIENQMFRFTGEEFVESRWIERAKTADDVLAFMERIRNGEDRNASLRGLIRHRDLSLADGHCGERVCDRLWEAMHKEDGVL